MTKSRSYALAAVGIAVIVLVTVLLARARLNAPGAPTSQGGLPGTTGKKALGETASPEEEYDVVDKLALGITLEAFKALRPNAISEREVYAPQKWRREQDPKRDNVTYVESSAGFVAKPQTDFRFGGAYFFKKGVLTNFGANWMVPGEDALSTVSTVVNRLRKRYGKEDQQTIRDYRWGRPGSPQNPSAELLWHRGQVVMSVTIGMAPGKVDVVRIMVSALREPVLEDSLHPLVALSDAEKRQLFDKFGIPPL